MPTNPVGNGEHAADKLAAEKAKADAKAEADRLKDERLTGTALLEPLTKAAKDAASGVVSALETLEERHLVLGRIMLSVEKVLTDYPALDMSVSKWAEENVPSVAGPVWGSSRAYHGLQAARVAEAEPTAVTLSVDALRAAHRVKDVKGAVKKAVTKATKDAKGGTVTAALVRDAVDTLYPKDEAKTPGPKTQTPEAKAAKAKNEPTKDVLVEVPDLAVSETKKKAAASRIDTILAQLPEDAQAVAISIVLQTLKGCEDYGRAAMQFAAEGGSKKAKAANAAAEKAKADALKAAKAAKAKATREANAAKKKANATN